MPQSPPKAMPRAEAGVAAGTVSPLRMLVMNDRGTLRVTGTSLNPVSPGLTHCAAYRARGSPSPSSNCGRLIQHLDVVQHLDPVDGAPAGHNEPQRKTVQQGKLLAVHGEGDHHLGVARVIDGERLQELRRTRITGSSRPPKRT